MYIQKYNSMIVEQIDKRISKWYKEEEIDMTYEASKLTFEVISNILLGQEFIKESLTVNYSDPAGLILSLPIFEAINRVHYDCAVEGFQMKNLILP